ncbi:MAG: hypothetical protein H6668_04360 [Ardenticatenaceae bacterium]|nr:hypothetical protein [Ardenticatenaceae bacterium]
MGHGRTRTNTDKRPFSPPTSPAKKRPFSPHPPKYGQRRVSAFVPTQTAVSPPTLSWDTDERGRTRTNGRFSPTSPAKTAVFSHIPQSTGSAVCPYFVPTQTAVFPPTFLWDADKRGQTAVFPQLLNV